MLHFTLNGRPVALPKSTNLKIVSKTQESNARSFSLPLTLNLSDPVVAEIFAPYLHPANSHQQEIAPEFELFCFSFSATQAPYTLRGVAQPLSIHQSELRVQLVSGRAVLPTLLAQWKSLRKMPLGKLWQKANPSPPEDAADTLPELVESLNAYLEQHAYQWDERILRGHDLEGAPVYENQRVDHPPTTEQRKAWERLFFGTSQETEAVAFPSLALDGERIVWVNPPAQTTQRRVESYKKLNKFYRLEDIITHERNGNYRLPVVLPAPKQKSPATLSPQPYLRTIVARLAQCIGLRLDDTQAPEDFGRLFLVNVRSTLEIADMLPDWAPEKLLEQIEALLNVRFSVEADRLIVRPQEEEQTEQPPTRLLQEVEDIEELRTDFENNPPESEDTGRTVGYDFEQVVPLLALPQSVLERAQIQTPPQDIAPQLTKPSVEQLQCLYTEPSDRAYRVYVEQRPFLYELEQVDQLRPRGIKARRQSPQTNLLLVPAPWHTDGTTLAIPDHTIAREDDFSISAATIGPKGVNHSDQRSPQTDTAPNRMYLAYFNQESHHCERKEQLLPQAQPAYLDAENIYYQESHTHQGGTPEAFSLERLARLPVRTEPLPLEDTDTAPTSQQQRRAVRTLTYYGPITQTDFDLLIQGRRYRPIQVEFTITSEGIAPKKIAKLLEMDK